MSVPVPVRLFGPIGFGERRAALGPRDFGRVKPKQLIELLLLERGRTVSNDRLADELWGEALPVSTAGTLETYVSVLRRRIRGGRDLIATSHGGYQVVDGAVSVDLEEFDRLARAAMSEEVSERYGYLAAAVALGREPVLGESATLGQVARSRLSPRPRRCCWRCSARALPSS